MSLYQCPVCLTNFTGTTCPQCNPNSPEPNPMILKCGQKVSIRASALNDLAVKANSNVTFPIIRHLGPSSGVVNAIRNGEIFFVIHDSDQSTGAYLHSELRDPITGQPFPAPVTPTPRPHPHQPTTPTLDQLKFLRHDIFTLAEFLDWLPNNNLVICDRNDDGFHTIARDSDSDIIYKHFGIDPKTVEAERNALHEYQRQLYELPQEEF